MRSHRNVPNKEGLNWRCFISEIEDNGLVAVEATEEWDKKRRHNRRESNSNPQPDGSALSIIDQSITPDQCGYMEYT